MEKINIKIYLAPKQKKDGSVSVFFEISNEGKNDIYVLKWNTPLEGLRNDCLEVKAGKKNIPYDSIIIERIQPVKDDFLLLKSGKSKEKKIIINEAYNIPQSGNISVRLKSKNLKIYSSIPNLNNKEYLQKSSILDFKIKDKKAANLKLKKRKKIFKTKGQKFRDKAKPEGLARTLENAEAAMPPVFTGANAEQQEIIITAHNLAYEKIKNAANNISNDDNFVTWFGEFDNNRFQTVKNNFQKMKNRMESIAFDYDTTRKECEIMMVAYTLRGGASFVALCNRFWDKTDDSRAAALIHEHSHASADTFDIIDISDGDSCKNLAENDPDSAITNANNYEFYSASLSFV